MISSNIKRIDSTSIEIKVKYRPKRKRFVRFKKYSLETYFFLPIETGVNKRNYTRIDFYRELKSYLKIDPPKVLLSEIADRDNFFMQLLDKSLSMYDVNSIETINLLEDRLKIFLNIFKKATKREVRKILIYPNDNEKLRVGLRFCSNLNKAAADYRNLCNKYLYLSEKSNKVNTIYSIGDEYISNQCYRYYLQLLKEVVMEDSNNREKLNAAIKQQLNQEIAYRKAHNFPLSSESKKKNELLINRWDKIKYFVTNKLIINTRIDKETRYIEEVLYSLSAGIAMVFATSVAFYYNKVFGNFTLRFFFVLVISYMFKDRIKEWFRSFFNTILHKQILDHRFNLYDDNHKKIGSSHDGFSFIPKTNMDKKIYALRYIEATEKEDWIEHDEKIMRFTRRIKINVKAFLKTFKNIKLRGVNDVITFNFSPIILRLEESKIPLYIQKNDKVKEVYNERNIPIHIVVAINFGKEYQYQHYEVKLNKNGIASLKTIALNNNNS